MTNEVGDWFNPRHTFIFANAVYQAICRSATPGVVKSLYHAALAVYMDRFLNVPAARLPPADLDLSALPGDSAALRRQFLAALDRHADVESAGLLVARHLRLGLPLRDLIDTLAYATAREDLDFHASQVLEAGWQQAQLWPGQPQAEHILIGVARQLAAHCPTPRAALQIATVASRLERGEKLYEDAAEKTDGAADTEEA
jgi:hypothetical protein